MSGHLITTCKRLESNIWAMGAPDGVYPEKKLRVSSFSTLMHNIAIDFPKIVFQI